LLVGIAIMYYHSFCYSVCYCKSSHLCNRYCKRGGLSKPQQRRKCVRSFQWMLVYVHFHFDATFAFANLETGGTINYWQTPFTWQSFAIAVGG
jgi:hypothetical protein